MITVSKARRPQVIFSDLTDVFTPFVVAIPNLGRRLKVVYALHNGGAHAIFKDTPVESKLVALTGEYIEQVQLPSTLVFPASSLACEKVKVPEGADFNRKRLDADNHKETWFQASKMTEEGLVPAVMPVPAFLVYDSFDTGIDAMVLYERWMKARIHNINSYMKYNTILRAFCKAQVVTPTSKERQTRLKASIFIQPAPAITLEWKKLVLSVLFSSKEANNEEKITKDDDSIQIEKIIPADRNGENHHRDGF